jgi:hypothetical protein
MTVARSSSSEPLERAAWRSSWATWAKRSVAKKATKVAHPGSSSGRRDMGPQRARSGHWRLSSSPRERRSCITGAAALCRPHRSTGGSSASIGRWAAWSWREASARGRTRAIFTGWTRILAAVDTSAGCCIRPPVKAATSVNRAPALGYAYGRRTTNSSGGVNSPLPRSRDPAGEDLSGFGVGAAVG